MGNIPFATLLVLLLALPGYISRVFYLSGKFNKSILATSFKDDIAGTVFFALPIHLVGIFLAEHIHLWFDWFKPINYQAIFLMMSGHLWDDAGKAEDMLKNSYEQIHWILIYFGGLIVLAGILGKTLSWIVWKFEWDLRWPSLFNFGNFWLYNLTGRGKRRQEGKDVFPIIDAMANLGGKTRLYRGIVYDFTTDETGGLREIFIKQALRGKLIETEAGNKEFHWEEIPGDIFILPYQSLLNINITYYEN